MAFVGLPGAEMPANRINSLRPQVLRVGPGTTQYGRVWPNEWPNGQLRHDMERRCVVPVTIEPAAGAPGGRASRCRRALRTCATAAADGVSLRVLDASLPGMVAGSPRRPITWTTSRRRRGASLPVLATARVAGPGRALALSSNRAASELERGAGGRSCRRSSSLDLLFCWSSEAVVSAGVERAPPSGSEQERRSPPGVVLLGHALASVPSGVVALGC
jgi:hypothetical protein